MELHLGTWAEQQFGSARLGDERRTRRVVTMASAMVAHPSASLPQQLAEWSDLKAAYRLLDTTEVTHAALLEAHWEQTRAAARQAHVVLLVQDTTEVDFTAHAKTRGLGPIGNGAGAGILVQSVLAIEPTTRQVLGLAAQEPFLRQAAPRGESCAQRRKRERESQVWLRAIEQVGGPPGGVCWVQVGDRYADMWGFFTTCAQQGCDFLVRAAQDRRVQPTPPKGAGSHLFAALPHLAEWDSREVEVPAQHGRPKRTARLAISGGPLTLLPPRQPSGQQPVRLWVIWVREIGAPPDGGDALEWVLLTSVPTADAEAAWERVAWYRCRWLVEEYHHCLKTGCGLERRQLREAVRLERVLGLLAPMAVYLLQLRDLARVQPQRLAREALPAELVQVVAYLAQVSVESLTFDAFWTTVARQGGYLGRATDPPPGWKALWAGWRQIQTLLEGVRLAAHLTL
jgi:hypothetical protein